MEFKFRAWDKTKKQMFYSVHPNIKNIPVWNSEFWGKIDADPDNYEVMQFTGFLDINGLEIYCKDKIEYIEFHHTPTSDKTGKTGIVEFKNGSFNLQKPFYNLEHLVINSLCEVKGNIYEKYPPLTSREGYQSCLNSCLWIFATGMQLIEPLF